MFDHLGIVVRDLQRSTVLYRRILEPLGYTAIEDRSQLNGEGWVVISSGAPQAPFFVVAAGRPSFWTETSEPSRSPAHLCFRAPSKDAVDRFHAIGLQLGAADNGAPGVRRPPFHCAFLIDYDGNNIEAGAYVGG
ncbi:MAG: VOC family protein [Hyphomonadaceae bacterium]